MNSIIVRAEWDMGMSVWTATSEDVPGLVAEGTSMETLRPKVMMMIEELIELNGLKFGTNEIPVHFVAQTTERLKTHAAA